MSRPVAHQADSQPTGDPPVHFPFRRAADILSRVRSPISSLSNCANESRMFSVSRPSDVLVLNCCVTATKLTLCFSKTLSMRVKSSSDPLSRSTLYTANAIQLARLRRTEQSRQRWPVHVGAGETAVVIEFGKRNPSFAPLALNERFSSLALRIERVKLLIESFLR
jgi:hypothetical protein